MIAIYPPDYFPTAETMGALSLCSVVVLADTVPYSRQSRHNRASIRNPNAWQWLSIPVNGGQRGRSIKDTTVNNFEPWRKKHWKALQFNYRSSPYFEFYEDRLADLYAAAPASLAELTVSSVIRTAKLFDLGPQFVTASELPGSPSTGEACLAAFPDQDHFLLPEQGGDTVCRIKPYRQNFEGFVPGLSAIDLLFNLGPRAITSFDFDGALT